MDDLVKPWDRLIKLARANLSPHLFPDDTQVRSVEEELARMRCSPNYPEVVAHNVALARELCVAGCLFYELFTASIQFSTAACEVALKERFIDQLSFPCRLT